MNLVLVVVDTFRRDAISLYNDEYDTPNLDRIADRSLVFEDMTATSCWTMPTHASMFTGLYPSRHGALQPALELRPSVPVVSELLAEAGYGTHAVNIPRPLWGDAGFDRGWDEFQNTYADPKPRQAWRLLKSWIRIGLLEEPSAAVRPSYIGALRENYRTRYAVDRVADLVARDGDRFVFTNLFAPHKDYRPLPRFAPDSVSEEARLLAERPRDTSGKHYQLRLNYGDLELDESVIEETRALYQGEVAWVDRNLGRLFDRLEAAGELDETVVLVTGDHGELFGEDRGMVEHRNSLHPALIDVPLVVYHPDRDAGRDDRLASHVDIAPTLLDAAGVAADHDDLLASMDGHSLFGGDRHAEVFAESGRSEHEADGTILELGDRYDLDLTPYYQREKAVRDREHTVRFRDDDTVIAYSRGPAGDVPVELDAETRDRYRDLVDSLDWTLSGGVEASEAVKQQLRDAGYLG